MISVIIPAYNAEKTIQRCLNSVLVQSYQQLEIIVVDDGSEDSTFQIVKEYQKKFANVHVKQHGKNKGLFAARLTGVAAAQGEYIGFVDSDDYVSVDYFRLLHHKAEESDADMVLGEFFLEYSDGTRKYFNLDPIRNQDLNLVNDEIMDTFMMQEGTFYGWQLVWNKLYQAELWKKNFEKLQIFSKQYPGLNMTEDIAFSVVLWLSARKIVNVHNAVYYYCQSDNQMTALGTEEPEEQNLKKLQDVYSVFAFFKGQLEEAVLWDRYKEQYDSWKGNYGRLYAGKFEKSDNIQRVIENKFFEGAGAQGKAGNCVSKNEWIYGLLTKISPSWEQLESMKRAIMNRHIRAVSFDVFDTCILRPFWKPTDLFTYMDPYFIELTNACSAVDYTSIRMESERCARKRKKAGNEDIDIDDIFAEMERKYCLEHDVCQRLKEKELELEIQFSTARKIGKELYNLALYCGKKIFFTSDMYLSTDIIAQLLKKSGYCEYEELFVSSETGVSKYTGHMYTYVLKKTGINAQELIHIGDDRHSDFDMPKKCKIRSYYIPKTKDLFCGCCSDIYSGKYWYKNIEHSSTNRDLQFSVEGFLGYRTMMAMAANKLFDNPFVSYNEESDFNASPMHIGYFLLGTYLYGITQWLVEQTVGRKGQTANGRNVCIHFAARDGYLVQKAYELFRQVCSLPDSNYLYVSRKALVLANVRQKADMLSLIDNFNIFNSSPEKFMTFFKDVMAPEDVRRFLAEAAALNYPANKKFASRDQYEDFLKLFIDKCWDLVEWEKYRSCVGGYLSEYISEGDLLFDIGYSGRVECALKNLLGYAVDSFYIHNNSEIIKRREQIAGFKNTALFDHKPNITGVIREHVFMKNAPSTIGYRYDENGRAVPVFEDTKMGGPAHSITELLQSYALEFVNDMISAFGKNVFQLFYRYEDAAQPFEFYLHHGKFFDRSIFSGVTFEDDFGLGKKVYALNFWSEEIGRLNGEFIGDTPANSEADAYHVYLQQDVVNQSVLKKALFWLKNDRSFFWKRAMQYIRGERY